MFNKIKREKSLRLITYDDDVAKTINETEFLLLMSVCQQWRRRRRRRPRLKTWQVRNSNRYYRVVRDVLRYCRLIVPRDTFLWPESDTRLSATRSNALSVQNDNAVDDDTVQKYCCRSQRFRRGFMRSHNNVPRVTALYDHKPSNNKITISSHVSIVAVLARILEKTLCSFWK